LFSCAPNTLKKDFPIRSSKASSTNLVFGFMSDSADTLVGVSITTVGNLKNAYDVNAHIYPNGLFFAEGLGSGRHKIASVSFSPLLGVKRYPADFEFDVKPGSITYVGSFDIVGMRGGFVRDLNSYRIILESTVLPDESTLLCWLLERVKDTPWYFIVEGHRAALYPEQSCRRLEVSAG
jgi:hypothetical protein